MRARLRQQQQHTDRPGTDELLIRYRLAGGGLGRVDRDSVAPCATADPLAFHPQHQSGVDQDPYETERFPLAVCDACPLVAACLVSEMRAAETVFDVRGIRAGLRQSERRRLFLALQQDGLL